MAKSAHLTIVPPVVGEIRVRSDRKLPKGLYEDLGRPPLYPWKTIAVEESFNLLSHVGKHSARVMASKANAKHYPKYFVVREYEDEGWVIWRVR